MNQNVSGATNAGHRQNGLAHWLSLIGIVGPIIFWIVDIFVGALKPDYSHLSMSISDMAMVNTSYATLAQMGMVVLGVGIIAFAIGLIRRFRFNWRSRIGILLIGLVGGGLVISGLFPDTGNTDVSSMLHSLGALMTFFSGLVGVPLMSWLLHIDERWPRYRFQHTVLGITILVVGTFILFLPPHILTGEALYPAFDGFFQRIHVGVLSGWVVFHSFQLYTLTETS